MELRHLILFFLFTTLLIELHALELGNSDSIQEALTNSTMEATQMWRDFEKKMKLAVNKMIKTNMATVMREVYSTNISLNCINAFLQFTTALRQTKLWAFQMLDASGKLPTGFLTGSITNIGDYDECVNIDVNQRKLKIQGKYCVVDIWLPMPQWRPFMPARTTIQEFINISQPDTVVTFFTGFSHNLHVTSIKSGICMPDACGEDDLNTLIQIIPKMGGLVGWKFDVNACETKTSFQFSTLQVSLVYMFIAIVGIVAIASSLDSAPCEFVQISNKAGIFFKILRCFSLHVNIRSIAKYNTKEGNLRFLYGFMYLCMIWIIAANAFLSINYDVLANILEALRMSRIIIYEMLASKVYPCQLLIFMSAFINTFRWMKSSEENGRVWRNILFRYLRYTLPYMFIIALMMLAPGWGSGPSWNRYVSKAYDNCKDNGWTNLLYVNNYIDNDKMCLMDTWYISVVAQLYVITLLVLIPLKKRPRVGLALNLFLAVGSAFAVFFANMYNEIPPAEILTFINNRDRLFHAKGSYFHFHYHGMVNCFGIFAGYLVATKPNMKIPAKLSYGLWILSFGTAFGLLFLVDLWSDGILPPQALGACYDVFSKMAWAAFIFWACVSCAIEQKGLCYDILSWRPFAFFGRLVFSAVIMNSTITTMIFSFHRSSLFVSDLEMFYFIANLIICNVIVAFTFHMGVESPIIQLLLLLKSSCGLRTTDNTKTSYVENDNQCEDVLSEKPPKTKTRSIRELLTTV